MAYNILNLEELGRDELLERTYLIQRLEKPVGNTSPFDFGVGGSGLNQRSQAKISNIWNWGYMGAWEYENGSVERAISKIGQYITEGLVFTGTVEVGDNKLVHLLCEGTKEGEIEKRIKSIYNNEEEFHLKSPSFFKDSIDHRNHSTIGWLELNNGFMFFKNKKAYNQTLDLFGIGPNTKKVWKNG